MARVVCATGGRQWLTKEFDVAKSLNTVDTRPTAVHDETCRPLDLKIGSALQRYVRALYAIRIVFQKKQSANTDFLDRARIV